MCKIKNSIKNCLSSKSLNCLKNSLKSCSSSSYCIKNSLNTSNNLKMCCYIKANSLSSINTKINNNIKNSIST